jgi:hypothetical protein
MNLFNFYFRFVDNIHVDSFFGIQENIGHQDFYPSGGKSQPGFFYF